jgi:hypothetical protein
MVPAPSYDEADVVFVNTCTIRENADNRLYGNPGHLKAAQGRQPEDAAGGRGVCRPEGPGARAGTGSVGRRRLGTHNLDRVLDLMDHAEEWGGITEIVDELQAMPSTAGRRELAHSAWVTIQVGCNNTCTFCIVPAVRGPRSHAAPATSSPEVERPRRRRGRRGDAARAERRHLRTRPGPRRPPPSVLRRPPPQVGAVEGPARPLHQPHPNDFGRSRRGHGRDPGGVRAAPLPAPERVRPHPGPPCTGATTGAATWTASRWPARSSPAWPSPPTSSSVSRARPTRTSNDPRGGGGGPVRPAFMFIFSPRPGTAPPS